MFTRKPKTSIFYAGGAPTRWVRAAAVSLDEKLAKLCVQHWQSVPMLAVAHASQSDEIRTKAAIAERR
jgi:hypothetical protein